MCAAAAAAGRRPVAAALDRKLRAALAPARLAISDDSHLHAGHSGNPSGAPDAESHFRIEIVSSAFEGKALVARHRMVYGVLADELRLSVHALSLKLHTPSEVS
eukprot:SM000004S15087  [mRNA]  locus=s4:1226286:1227029:+ [translate_table: standard]